MKLNKVIYFLVIVFIVNPISLYSKNIEEIVVTGTKNKTPIIDETGNLSFINSEEINFISADNPSNILNRMPGVFISQGSGQEHLTSIRSPVLSGGAGAGSFLYLEDGIPLRSPGFSNVNGLMESTIESHQRQIEVDEPDDEDLSLLIREDQRGKEDNADDTANEDLLRALMDAQTSEDK